MSEVFVRGDLVWDESAVAGHLVALRASRCDACGRTEFPALDGCPACGTAVGTIPLGPEAVLAGFTEVLHPPPGAQVEVPYTIAVAAFPENLAVLGLLDRHIPAADLQIGAALEVCVLTCAERHTYGFRLR